LYCVFLTGPFFLLFSLFARAQLWSSFSALMQGREIPPIAQPVPVCKKRYKFDTVTKNKLTTMNLHLKKHYPVECATETQLVNDKRLAKEAPRSRGNKLAVSISEPPDVPLADSLSSVSVPEAASHDSSDAVLKMRSSSGSLDRSNNPFLKQDTILQTRSSTSTSTNKSHSSKSKDLILNTRSSADSLDQHRAMPALTDLMSGSADEDHPLRGYRLPSPGARDFESDSNPGLEVTLGQFESKYTQPSPTESSQSTRISPTDSQSSVPSWSGIRLRRVSSAANPDEDASSSVATPSTAAVPWAKVALRRVDGLKDLVEEEKKENDVSLQASSSDVSDMAALRRSSAAKAPGGPISGMFRLPRPADLNLPRTTTKSVEEKQDDSTRVRDKIDEAVVFRLSHMPNMKESEEARVMVGKKAIMMVHSEAGESQARVIWKLPREVVHSLTLDMASQQVKLILADNTGQGKILSFSTSDDCLRFANAFYEMPNALPRRDVPSTIDAKDVDTVASSVKLSASNVDDGSADSESHHTEQLNDEEHTVLERYRRLRKTKPAEEALHESIGSSVSQQKEESSLSSAEEEIANKYRRMLKVNIPLDAVKHKMTSDSVGKSIVELVVSEAVDGPPTFVGADQLPSSPLSTMSFSVAMSTNEMEVVESYKRMLRLKIPQDAVRHKMEKDNVDPKIMALILGDENTAPSNSDSTSQSVLSVEKEKIAATYRKMLKMCIPSEAVRHKMARDEVDATIVLAVLGQEKVSDHGKLRAVAESDSFSVTSKASKGKPSLTDGEESVASQYRKLLKLQIPKDQVLQRMKKEGIEETIIVAVVGDKMSQSGAIQSKDEPKTGSKLVSLHWTPLSGKELDNSVWKATKSRDVASAQPEGSDISKLVELFQKKTNANVPKDKKCDDSVGSTAKAKLLDITRSNNVAISLKAFKDFSKKELGEIIAFIDPTRKIRGERVEFLRDLLPTANEIKIVTAYNGDENRLVPAEKWFRKIADIKRIESKIDVMRTMEMFVDESNVLNKNFRLLTRVCNQVMNSAKLQHVLEMVLRVGNIMNEGTRTGGASGFKFDSLLRLTQTKSSDGKTTVLDFLVTTFVAKGQRETLNLSADFPDCQTASRMLVSDLISEVKNLQTALKQCEDELLALNDDVSGAKSTPAVNSAIVSGSGGSNVELMASILSCGNADSAQLAVTPAPKVERFTKRDQFLKAIKEGKTQQTDPSSSDTAIPQDRVTQLLGLQEETKGASPSLKGVDAISNIVTEPEKENSLQGGIARLDHFLREGKSIFVKLDSDRSLALSACRDLSKYCAEASGVGATSTLLGILAEFASNIDTALKKHDEQQEAESRRQRKKGGPSAQPDEETDKLVTTKEPASSGQGKSLVFLVNEMLQEANNRTKEDFKKGRVYPQASDRLKAIYQKEKIVDVFGSPGSAMKKLDIVSAIREREGKMDQHEVQQARSEFSRVMNRLRALEKEKPLSDEKPEANGVTLIESETVCSLLETVPEKVVFDVRRSQQRLVKSGIGSPERPTIKVASAIRQFETTKLPLTVAKPETMQSQLLSKVSSPVQSTRAVAKPAVPAVSTQPTPHGEVKNIDETKMVKSGPLDTAGQSQISLLGSLQKPFVMANDAAEGAETDKIKIKPPMEPLSDQSVALSELPASSASLSETETTHIPAEPDASLQEITLDTPQERLTPFGTDALPMTPPRNADPKSGAPIHDTTRIEPTSLDTLSPIAGTTDVMMSTPPRKPLVLPPGSTERKSLLEMAKDKRTARSAIPRREVSTTDSPTSFQAAEIATENAFAETGDSSSKRHPQRAVAEALFLSVPETNGELKAAPQERESFTEQAKAMRASQSSVKDSTYAQREQSEATSSAETGAVDTIPDDARGTIIESALIGHVHTKPTTNSEIKNESTMAKLARTRREEKTNAGSTSAVSPFIDAVTLLPHPIPKDTSGESTVARLARRKREEKMRRSPPKTPERPSALVGVASGTPGAQAISAISEVASDDPGSSKRESAMVRMARLKREEKKAVECPNY
jgi:hypothetical protein